MFGASEIVLAIRGTKELADWMVNLDARRGDDAHHMGYSLVADWFGAQVQELIAERPAGIRLCGHSMGGTVAALLGEILIEELPGLPIETWTFGSPAVLSRKSAVVNSFGIPGDPVSGLLNAPRLGSGERREYLLVRGGMIHELDGTREARLLELVEAIRATRPAGARKRGMRVSLAQARPALLRGAATDEVDESELLLNDYHAYVDRPRNLSSRHAIDTYGELIEQAAPPGLM